MLILQGEISFIKEHQKDTELTPNLPKFQPDLADGMKKYLMIMIMISSDICFFQIVLIIKPAERMVAVLSVIVM